MVPGICLALSSQFCFVWADLITVYALPTRWWGDSPLRPHQQSEHSSYQFSGAGRKRAPLFQLFPKKVLVLFRLLFGHILQEREKYTHGPALDHMLNPGTRKKGQWKGVNRRWEISIKRGSREKAFLPLSFDFTMVPTQDVAWGAMYLPLTLYGRSLTHLHLYLYLLVIITQVECPGPQFDTCTVLPWWKSWCSLFSSKYAQNTLCSFGHNYTEKQMFSFHYLTDNSWCLNNLPHVSLPLSFEFSFGVYIHMHNCIIFLR